MAATGIGYKEQSRDFGTHSFCKLPQNPFTSKLARNFWKQTHLPSHRPPRASLDQPVEFLHGLRAKSILEASLFSFDQDHHTDIANKMKETLIILLKIPPFFFKRRRCANLCLG